MRGLDPRIQVCDWTMDCRVKRGNDVGELGARVLGVLDQSCRIEPVEPALIAEMAGERAKIALGR